MIGIIDYGMGNLGSIANMLKRVGAKGVITSNVEELDKFDKLILPGVGSFDNGMKNLEEKDLIQFLNYKILNQKIPILGICLGMQLFARKSEEGKLPGLGWIEADVIRFNFADNKLKVPHMGWNTIDIRRNDLLFEGLPHEKRFYFVHSYYVKCDKHIDVLSETEYGIPFTSAVNKENIWGTQFHPEKSHKFGMQVLKNFVENN